MTEKPIISLRDDDINYFTDAEKLSDYYSQLFTYFKPTLCVTPLAGEVYWLVRQNEAQLLGRESKREYVRQIQREKSSLKTLYPVTQNQKLIILLREWASKGLIEIALHGITHNQTPNGYECEHPSNYYTQLTDIKRKLEDDIGVNIEWFSPPNNTLGRAWFDSVESCGMNIVYSWGPRPWQVKPGISAFMSILRIASKIALNGRQSMIYEPLSLGSIKMLQSLPLGPGTTDRVVTPYLHQCSQKGKGIVLATHSYGFDIYPETFSTLLNAGKLAANLGFKPGFLAEHLFTNHHQ